MAKCHTSVTCKWVDIEMSPKAPFESLVYCEEVQAVVKATHKIELHPTKEILSHSGNAMSRQTH